VARQQGIPMAFTLAAADLVVGLAVLRKFVVVDPGNANFSPSQHWPDPVLAVEPSPESGPVLISTDFEIALEDAEAFVAAMHQVRRLRLRDGALRWTLFQDMAEPTSWTELFLVESWNEHLRQHVRITHADKSVEVEAHAFHRGVEPPRVRHMLASTALPKSEEPDVESDSE
jgi:quinol monooxygenase YgiN